MNNRTIILLLLLLTLSVYANSLTGEFVWDDDFLILENPSIMSFTHVWTYFVLDLYQSYSNYYRPIQALSNAVDFALWGANPFGFHLTNVLLHMAVIALYFGIVNFITGDRRVASVAAALFAVHPAHVAVVAYIAGRADTLCALFMLLSLIFFYRHFTASRKDGSRAQYILSLAFFILALMSKEIAVIFPAVILLCRKFFVSDNMAGQSRERIRFHYLSWYVIVAAVYSLLRVYALNFSGTDMFISGRAGLYSRLLTSMQSLISYLGVLFAPVHLSMDRSLPPAASFWGGWVP